MKDNEALRLRVERLELTVAQRNSTIAMMQQQIVELKGYGANRPADLFAPVRIEIVSRSGGQDYDGNYHVAGWRPGWLASELKEIGFEVKFVGDGNVQDFGLPFERQAGVLRGANGWDMLAVAARPSI